MERCCWSAQVCVKLHGDLRSSFLTSFSEEKRVQVYTFNRHNEHNQAVRKSSGKSYIREFRCTKYLKKKKTFQRNNLKFNL